MTLNKPISTSNRFEILGNQHDVDTDFTRLAHCREVHIPDDNYMQSEEKSTGEPGAVVNPSPHGTVRNSVDIAHLRLGHLHEAAIKSAAANNLLTDFNVKLTDNMHPCIPCLKGKARKGTPPPSQSTSTAIGDLIHMDICGPLEDSSAGNRYILTAVDDFSNMLHTWALKTKASAFRHIQEFLRYMQNHY